jgi:hypothetical protein
MGEWKLDDEVHGDCSPRTFWDFERLEETEWLVAWDFDACASVTSFYIASNISIDARPRIVSGHKSECAVATRVTCSELIMTIVKNIST